tara:strand:- start:66 stop:266 length:201 start_codon:yes stop_codon:yes gene_type:complete
MVAVGTVTEVLESIAWRVAVAISTEVLESDKVLERDTSMTDFGTHVTCVWIGVGAAHLISFVLIKY